MSLYGTFLAYRDPSISGICIVVATIVALKVSPQGQVSGKELQSSSSNRQFSSSDPQSSGSNLQFSSSSFQVSRLRVSPQGQV